jgi:hypothetical protein
MNQIPSIKFPASWKIQVLPPFAGAVVRFKVEKPNGKKISVYLDCYDNLGYMGVPYWEIYPDKDGDISRFLMKDVEDLVNAIKKVR